MTFNCPHCRKKISNEHLAHYLASRGGSSRSTAKKRASRMNGRLGGRPKIVPAPCFICQDLTTYSQARGLEYPLCKRCFAASFQEKAHDRHSEPLEDCPLCRPDLFPNWPT